MDKLRMDDDTIHSAGWGNGPWTELVWEEEISTHRLVRNGHQRQLSPYLIHRKERKKWGGGGGGGTLGAGRGRNRGCCCE